jgi:methyl-accepting chemotaxis protein
MNFNNLRLRTKLAIGFGAIALIAAIIGITSYISMNRMISRIEEIADVRLPSVKSLLIIDEGQRAFQASQNALLAINVTQQMRQATFRSIEEAKKRIDEAWRIYEPLPQSQEESMVWKEFVPVWSKYIQMHERFVEIAKQYEANPTEESYNKMSNFALIEIVPFFENAENLLGKLVEINGKISADENLKAHTQAASSILLLEILVVVGIALALLFGVGITKSVLNDVGGEPAEVKQIAIEVANGNLTQNFDESQNLKGIYGAIASMSYKLKEVISSVIAGAGNIAAATEQMSSTSQELSQGASEQASSVEEISSSMEEMASNIQQNTDNAQQTDKIATSASERIQRVSVASAESAKSIKNIAEKIVIINDIAFQTNILALNAAVEAARAGEQGRGFAVVAAEVRKLAERSKLAADEINVLARNSVKVTEESTLLLNQIIPEIQNTAKLVQEITAASLEQSTGADQVNNAIQMLNRVTQQNAAASEELATSAEEMTSQAEQLRDLISYFRVDRTSNNGYSSEKFDSKPQIKVFKNSQGNNLNGNNGFHANGNHKLNGNGNAHYTNGNGHTQSNGRAKDVVKKFDIKTKGVVLNMANNGIKDDQYEKF